MKILVFGATGQLGGASALALKSAGHEVVACGRRTVEDGRFKAAGIEYRGNVVLEDSASFDSLPTDVDAVVHMAGAMPAQAGDSPMPFVQSIVVGMVNVCEWMRRGTCRRIVFNTTPSDIAHHFGTATPVDDDASRSFPHDGGDHAVYAICKSAAVDILEHYRIAYGLKPIVFRHLTVYGWTQDETYVINGIRKILPWRLIMNRCIAGEPVEVWGDPNRKKELLYIDDFTEAIRRACENSDVCGLFNLPGPRPYTMEEQVDGLISAFSPKEQPSKKIYCPWKPATPQNLLCGNKLERALCWKPQIDWFRACERMRRKMDLFMKRV